MKKTWQVIPSELHKKPYSDRMLALEKNFNFDGGRSMYRFPTPETNFEKEVYGHFQELVNKYDIPRIEYVIPLIKEFVINTDKKETAILFRYQMDFAIGKGFQIKEMVFHGVQGKKLEEIFEEHSWTGPSSLDYSLSQIAKVQMDPMHYLLRGNAFVFCPDYHGLELQDKKISIISEFGNKRIIEF